jgi:hypothetical protein
LKSSFLFLTFLVLNSQLFAQGVLDNFFSSDGILHLDPQGQFDVIGGLAERPDSKYIIASFSGEDLVSDDFLNVSCVDTFGVIDNDFAINGHFTMDPIHGVYRIFQNIQTNEDNSIIVGWVSMTANETGFVKLDQFGDLVSGFGIDGIIMLDNNLSESYFQPREIVSRPSGGYVIAGTVYSDTNPEQFHPGLMFLSESYFPDSDYGVNGFIDYPTLEGVNFNSICINSEQEMMMAGTQVFNSTENIPSIFKCDSNGIPVNSFGVDGLLLFNNNEFPENSVFSKIREYPTTGYSLLCYSPSTFGITRLGENGNFLPFFASSGSYDGLFEFNEQLEGNYSQSLINQIDNKMLSVCSSGNDMLSVFKVTAPGNFDYAFGNNGLFQSNLGSSGGALYPQIFLLENGKILGGLTRGEDYTLTLFRLTNFVGVL